MSITWLLNINECQLDTLPETEHRNSYSYRRVNINKSEYDCNLVCFYYGCRRDRLDIQIESDAKICGGSANPQDKD